MRIFTLLFFVATGLWAPGIFGTVKAEGIAGEYRIIDAAQPGGGGKYGGTLNVTAQGPAYQFQWALDTGDKYSGPAIMSGGVVGVGYGQGLTGLAVYEIKGKTLKAKWLLPATPENVGDYELTGPATLNGVYKVGAAGAGTVTIKPKGKVYDVTWKLPTGTFTGVGIRVGDTLTAVSGSPGSPFGVAVYQPGNSQINGVWTVMGATGLGVENLVLASEAPATAAATPAASASGDAFSADGSEVRFGGEAYRLQSSVSAPGQPTSELREYLRPGENFEKYGKMVALRLQNPSGADPLAFSRVVLAETKKSYPKAITHEIAHTADSATMEFVITVGTDIEYDFWHFFKAPGGLASVQFVLRSQPPFDSDDKIKAEHDSRIGTWLSESKAMTPLVSAVLGKTAKTASPPATPPAQAAAGKAGRDDDDELVTKIQADFQTAGGIAEKFLLQVQAGKFDDATAVVADEGMTRMHTTRKDFLASLQETQRKDGKLLAVTPDRSKPDFGAEAGGIYFVLEADCKYEKATAREKLRFFRFPDGKVKMVGYQRTPQPAVGH